VAIYLASPSSRTAWFFLCLLSSSNASCDWRLGKKSIFLVEKTKLQLQEGRAAGLDYIISGY
jgi:hypothetical protein